MLMKLFMDKGVQTKVSPNELILISYKQNDHIEKLPVTLLNATSPDLTNMVDYHFYTYEQIIKIFNTPTATTSRIQGNAELLLLMKNNNVSFFFKIRFFLPERNDHFYANFLDIFNKRIPVSFVCNEMAANFSFIHLLSLHGYSKSIETCVKYFGRGILTCLNIDHFTPLYLSLIFDRKNKTVNTILENSDNKQLVFPRKNAEKHFVYNLATKFYFSKGENRRSLCFLQFLKRPLKSPYKTIQQYKCFKSYENSSVKTSIFKPFVNDLKFTIHHLSFEKLRQSFLEKNKSLNLFWGTTYADALLLIKDGKITYQSYSQMLKQKRFICIQYISILKLSAKKRHITVISDEVLDVEGKTLVITKLEKHFLKKIVSKRFEDLCKNNLDDFASVVFDEKGFSKMRYETMSLYNQFYISAKKYFQKLFLGRIFMQSPYLNLFLVQKFKTIVRNDNDFKMFSDNVVYKHKYMDAIKVLPLVQFSFRHNLTVQWEYLKTLSPNLDYIISSMSSEQKRNVYKKL
ncbi:uncharacterized protein LOC128243533 [Mya arenaria]|uniref:uncharacterized protein LOC128243533 n=1 Tax=Mya arenaria TaxID=6604 RepID=UPI0022E7E0A3|nr:uncharacterized protein LOC128243533 [Mya arenaria]